jgi:hypothetical protein
MRVRWVTAVALVCGGVLAGVQPVEAASDPQLHKAESVARAGVVLRDDIPIAFTESRAPEHNADRDDKAFAACLGTTPRYVAWNRGTSWVYWENLGTVQERAIGIFSTASVAPAVGDAVAEQQTMRTDQAAQCYRERLATMISRDLRSRPESVNVDVVAATVKGADEAWAWQFTFNRMYEGMELSGKGYVVGSRVGRTLLTVTVLGNRELGELPAMLDLAAQPVRRVRAVSCQPVPDLQSGNATGVLDC